MMRAVSVYIGLSVVLGSEEACIFSLCLSTLNILLMLVSGLCSVSYTTKCFTSALRGSVYLKWMSLPWCATITLFTIGHHGCHVHLRSGCWRQQDSAVICFQSNAALIQLISWLIGYSGWLLCMAFKTIPIGGHHRTSWYHILAKFCSFALIPFLHTGHQRLLKIYSALVSFGQS